MDPFAALTLDWQARATGQHAGRAIALWGEAAPALAGFTAPAELVAQINQAGHPARSCTLLAELLVLAAADRLAARATLQAVIPGLRRAATRRWAKARASGPWSSHHELAADTINAAWEAIHLHAGERQARPARVITRHVEGVLRRTHTRWVPQNGIRLPLQEVCTERPVTTMTAHTPEEQAAELIAQAVHCGVIDPLAGVLLVATGVLGFSVSQAARDLGLPPGTTDRRLGRAREAMRIWLGLPLEVQAEQVPSEHPTDLNSGPMARRYPMSEPAHQVQPVHDDGVPTGSVPPIWRATRRKARA